MTGAGAIATASEAPAGVKPAIRIKAPTEGETIVHDRVQGDVRFPNKDLDDFIILRSDGIPTYMHAVVVDDHDMGVTHIIRGDDHLTNAARQTVIYQAMGWEVPVMAHIPLIHGPDGAQAFEAPRRARRRRLPCAWATCRRRCRTIWCALAGAMATTRS